MDFRWGQCAKTMLCCSKTCTVEECAKLCFDQKDCNYFIVGNDMINGVEKTGEGRNSCMISGTCMVCALFASHRYVIWALHYTTSCHQGIASARRPRTDAKMRTTFSLVIRMIFMSFVVLVKGRVRNSILRESTGEARRRTMQRSRHTTKKSWAAAKITSPRSIALTVRKVPALISVVLHVSPKVSVCLLMTLSWFEAWSRHRSDQGCIHLIRRHTCPVANHSKKFLVGKWVLCSHCL